MELSGIGNQKMIGRSQHISFFFGRVIIKKYLTQNKFTSNARVEQLYVILFVTLNDI
jgi:hypothetical protein